MKENIRTKIQNFFQSPKFGGTVSKLIIVIGILLVALALFLAGEAVGFRKAQFSYGFGQNYGRIFGERGGMGELRPFDNQPFPNIHGSVGKIVKIELPNIIIADNDGVEKVVVIATDSLIKRFRDTATSSDLKVGDMVTVLGAPNNNGSISAQLIRIMPAAAASATTSPAQ